MSSLSPADIVANFLVDTKNLYDKQKVVGQLKNLYRGYVTLELNDVKHMLIRDIELEYRSKCKALFLREVGVSRGDTIMLVIQYVNKEMVGLCIYRAWGVEKRRVLYKIAD